MKLEGLTEKVWDSFLEVGYEAELSPQYLKKRYSRQKKEHHITIHLTYLSLLVSENKF